VVTVAIALSGSRGALLWTAGSGLICAAAFIWGAPWKHGGGGALRIVRTIQRALLFGGAALILLFMFNPTALMSRWAFYSETLAWGTPQSELVYRVRDYPLQNFIGAFNYPRWPYGYGIGTASLGVQYVTRFFHAEPPTRGTENGYGQILIELGIVGLVLWIVMSVLVSRSCWQVVRKLKGSPWFPLAFVIGWYAFLLLIPLTYNGMVAYQNFVENAFLWLLIGILFRIPKIALSSQFAADARPQKPSRWKR
jgi:O-antigen ligase